MVTTLHDDFTMSLSDFTPLQRFRPGGSVSVYDRVHTVIREATERNEPLKRSAIDTMVNADGGKRASTSAIRKSLQRLVARDLILDFQASAQARTTGSREKCFVSNTATGISLFYSLTTAATRGDLIDDFVPLEEERSQPEAFRVGQSSETASGTSISVPHDVHNQIETGTGTHPKWDNAEAVPLENPDAATDSASGTNLGANRESIQNRTPKGAPLSLDELL